jgi:hypothetical protein
MKRRTFLSCCALSVYSATKLNPTSFIISSEESGVYSIGKKANEMQLFNDVDMNPVLLNLNKSELNILISEDFMHQKIIDVDGWILSQTEVKYCYQHYLENQA